MKLRRHLDIRTSFICLYVLALAVYLVIGLKPAEAIDYAISTKLLIPSIGLESDVTKLGLDDNHLNTPETIVGSYSQAINKTLLIGHSSTVFKDLQYSEIGNLISYDGKNYKIIAIDILPKDKINMSDLLAAANRDTLIVMTCAGEMLENNDATHRLILTAIRMS